MSAISHIPKPIDGDPIQVIERKVREFECPNPDCDQNLDITNINEGTKIKCESCGNITWVPAFEPKWWQRAKVIVPGLILSFVVGVLSSLSASTIFEAAKTDKAGNSSPSVIETAPNNPIQPTPKDGAADG